jgi:hypothetical protein
MVLLSSPDVVMPLLFAICDIAFARIRYKGGWGKLVSSLCGILHKNSINEDEWALVWIPGQARYDGVEAVPRHFLRCQY